VKFPLFSIWIGPKGFDAKRGEKAGKSAYLPLFHLVKNL
jgi:hypothetical protein